MEYLDPGAVAGYVLATELAADAWLLPATEYVGRYICLLEMLAPGDALVGLVEARLSVLAPGGPVAPRDHGTDEFLEAAAPGWLEHLSDPKNVSGTEDARSSEDRTLDSQQASAATRFITATSPALGGPWELKISDPDFFPSIPHGHLRAARDIRLDVYRGLTFNRAKGERPEARERRQFIVALWNDNSFRDFATRAIRHFMLQKPGHCWRVPNPLRLPRIRL